MSEESQAEPKLSALEGVKRSSNYLRGTIAAELSQDTDHFGKDSVHLLKVHGTYQQDNRDDRQKTAGKKSEKSFMFMVRTKIPGGKLTCEQLLAELDLADELGNATLRVTTRQGLQLHGVLKRDLWRTIHRINEVQLSTLAACGDVERNVMCCPAPHYGDGVHAELQSLADRLAEHLCPRTTAYHEIWVRDPDSGQDQLLAGGSNGHEVEPIYGATYLPRKFKTAIGLPGDNCVDLYANDLGLLAICENWQVVGYNVLVGGGFGVTPSAAKTFPAVAKRMAYCRKEDAVEVATAIVKAQRDYGNRSDRKVARLKYTIANLGLDVFRQKVEGYLGRPLDDPHPDDVWGFDDHLGWHEQGDGRWFYGLNIENGRIKDEGGLKLKTALREVCRKLRPGVRLTAHQSMLLTDLSADARPALEELLRRHGVPLSDEISNARRWSMACPAWPTCGLAVAESERALPGVIDQLEVELARLGLSQEVFTVRMTGCPNGCARPYNSDVGLVGRTAGKYTVYLGGRLLGDRLNFVYQDLVPGDQIVAVLRPILVYFKQARGAGETFGDFCQRQGAEALKSFADEHARSEVAVAH
jgi:sulfite reductase (ferredoxin)